MPTIHIHNLTNDQALNLVATFLTEGLSISIDLTDVPATKLARLDASTKRAAAPPANYRTIDARPTTKRPDWAERQQAYDERRLLAEEATIATKCTTCKVGPGRPCRTSAGKPYRAFVHNDRLQRLQALRAVMPTPAEA